MNYEKIGKGYIYPSTITKNVSFIETQAQKYDNTKSKVHYPHTSSKELIKPYSTIFKPLVRVDQHYTH